MRFVRGLRNTMWTSGEIVAQLHEHEGAKLTINLEKYTPTSQGDSHILFTKEEDGSTVHLPVGMFEEVLIPAGGESFQVCDKAYRTAQTLGK